MKTIECDNTSCTSQIDVSDLKPGDVIQCKSCESLLQFRNPGPHLVWVTQFDYSHVNKGSEMKIYVASSWKNPLQPSIVHILKRCGHDVYDFRNPPNSRGFQWTEVMPDYSGKYVTPDQYKQALTHPRAVEGYQSDIQALKDCDAVVYVMPAGRSASWEFGYAMGQGKKGYVVMIHPDEPDLMFSEAKILSSLDEVFDVFLFKEREDEINCE